jgi:hypothetical protein
VRLQQHFQPLAQRSISGTRFIEENGALAGGLLPGEME